MDERQLPAHVTALIAAVVLVLAGASAVVLLAYGVSAAAGARVWSVRASPFLPPGESVARAT